MSSVLAPNIQRNNVAEDMKSNLLRDTRALLEACGCSRGGNWISRTVRDYLAAPIRVPFGMFVTAALQLSEQQRQRLAARDDLRYLMSYSDPTGETAIRNVMRERHE